MKKMTMADIAKVAGVSKTTVSRYFNGGYVKEETRQKIEKIVKEYDYEPNVLAANLKANKTHTVGIVCPTLTSYASSRMMMNIDQFLKKHHYTTIIINTNHDELDEIKSITKLMQLRVDGIILLATSITMAHRDITSKSSVPIVFMAQSYDDGVSVINNDYEAGYKIGEYIYSNGHKNVVYAGVSRKDVAVGVIRRQGVYDGLQDVHPYFLETDFSAEKTMDKLNDYLKNHTCPTAIICATDTIAMGCMKVLKDHGLRIPEDVSVTGFGGYWTSTVMSPALTTIKFHYAHAGQMAGQIILDMIEEKEVERATLIDFSFIEGESVRSILCFFLKCGIGIMPIRGVNMNYEDGLLTIDMNKSSSGRGVKHIKIHEMNNMTLFSDTSSLELFINDGAYAFTTRIYNNSDTIEIISNKEIDMTAYQLKSIDLEPAK